MNKAVYPALVAMLALAACDSGTGTENTADAAPTSEANSYVNASTDIITEERLINADSEPGNWMTNGRSYRETHYSPLKQITDRNVGELGLAWSFDLETRRGQEATPLVVNGVMYVSTAWSKLKALDARTGKLIWEFDPHVPPEDAARTCCDAVNRGAALWNDKVYIGTLDGRLIAVDARTGRQVWSVNTFEGEKGLYNITGAPRVGGGKVFIGQGGGDRGSRGFASAYDAETGELIWRFYLTPGNPADGFENAAMERAAKTWDGKWWENGTGGTPWNSFAYDPELNTLYIGAGNAGPWDKSVRSPGDGDNLYVASIVAVDADTGEYKWHFQNTPGDAWDFTAVQPMVLADLNIGGRMRKVIMQAPKNGYFYVLDRVTGEFISAKGIAPINWSLGLDDKGRPTINPEAKYYETGRPFVARPGIGGAHNWQPMSYSRDTGLIYIPVMESPTVHRPRRQLEGATETEGNVYGKSNPAFLMDNDNRIREEILNEQNGYLLAWDPVEQKEVWRYTMPAPFNGGTLSTAGNLVFEGGGNGNFFAFDARTGKQLWRYDVYGGIIAAPATYTVDGEQYIAVMQGWGGGYAMGAGAEANMSGPKRNIPRVLAFKLGGQETLPEPPPWPELDPPELTATQDQVAAGMGLFNANCARCHGGNAIAGGTIPDLRYSAYLHDDAWFNIVIDGALRQNGMIGFEGTLSRDSAARIRDYVIARAHQALDAQEN